MHRATLSIDPNYRIAEADPRLYGSLVEHLGRCVYGGIHEDGHPDADPDGFRGDVAELVRELGVTLFRYPGGNFVSGYNWEDGIGPVDQRPARLDLAWRTVERNRVGVDEFLPWAGRAGGQTMLAVNLGSRGLDAARTLVEYCNYPSGTAWSDLRRRNGAADPYGVKLWCLGNEMDGPWQIGHKTAREYGRLAANAANAMRRVDPSIELVACGSSNSMMPTFGSWEATVLEEAYELVDYLALHHYFQQHGDDRDSFLASAVVMDRFIDAAVATCDHARAVGRHRRRIDLCFDEWNVWYQREREFAGEENLEMATDPPHLIEDTYSVVDAVVVGDLLISLLRHADRVKIGCLAQLVNVIAPIRSEPGGPAWRQTSFHPFALTSRHGRGTVLRVEPRSPVHQTRTLGEVPLLDAIAVLDEESGTVALFAVNRDQHQPMALEVDLRSLPGLDVGEHVAVFDQDPDATNSAVTPDRITPSRQNDLKVGDGRMEALLPPLSWSMIRLHQDRGR